MAQDADIDGGGEPRASQAAAYRRRAVWIARHILPHEAELRRALARRAPAGFEVDDIVQEIYARLAGLATVDHIHNPKSYIFRMSAGVMMDYVRHQKVVPIHAVDDVDEAGGVSNDPSPEAFAVDRDQLRRLMRVLSDLPPRVAEVFRLRRIEGLSQKEVSRKLAVAESTVEKHMARGVYLIAQAFEAGGNAAAQPTKSLNRKLSRDRDR